MRELGCESLYLVSMVSRSTSKVRVGDLVSVVLSQEPFQLLILPKVKTKTASRTP